MKIKAREKLIFLLCSFFFEETNNFNFRKLPFFYLIPDLVEIIAKWMKMRCWAFYDFNLWTSLPVLNKALKLRENYNFHMEKLFSKIWEEFWYLEENFLIDNRYKFSYQVGRCWAIFDRLLYFRSNFRIKM